MVVHSPKIKYVGILVQLDDGKIYQSLLKKEHEKDVLDLLSRLNGGSIKILEKPLESLGLSTDE